MKKTAFLFLLFTVCAAAVSAQSKTKGGWGFKLGANAANIRVEDAEDSRWKTGLAAGLFFKFNINNGFAIQPEFLYSSMGGKEVPNTTNAVDGTVTGSSLRLNYFSIPLLLKWKAGPVAVVAGPQLDLLIKGNFKNNNNNFTSNTEGYTETSFNGTAGLEFWPTHCLGLTARYIYGFSNINPETVNATGGNAMTSLRNQGVQLTLGVKL